MRKTVSLALVLTFVFAAISPTFAQRGKDLDNTVKIIVRSVFETTRAITDGNGVLVRWQMKNEDGIVAYEVYRLDSGQRVVVTPRLIISTAGRFGDKYSPGEPYNFFDADGQAGSIYQVEGRLLNGGRVTSKELAADAVKSVEAEVGTSSETYLEASRSTNSNIEQRTPNLDADLQSLVSSNEQAPSPTGQLYVASKPGAKIGVKKDGFYRVTTAELQTANFPINSDSTKWRLFMNGNEQAITVGPGSSYIEFYGKGIDTPYTDTRIYFLIADTVAGKRIGTKVLRQIPGAAASSRYSVKATKKERENWDNQLFNDDDEDFLGRLLSSSPSVIRFNLSGVDFSAPTVKLKINLFGQNAGRHSIRPRINGNDLPLMIQFDRVFIFETFTIPTSQLVEGTNELELTTTNSPADYAYFDNLEVTYSRKYSADQDKVAFTTPTSKRVDITGFSTSNVRVFDITNDGNPVRLANVGLAANGSEFTAKVPSGRAMVGYAVEDSAMLQAASITENFPSSISATTNAADMVIISYSNPGFLNAAETWATYRRSTAGGGLSVKVIDVADVYDEFGYGQIGYHPIKDFLKRASTQWATRPSYVMLIGDGSYDPRKYLMTTDGNWDLMPSANVRLIHNESVSDDALVDFDDDGLAELAIGRIPARTVAQITTAYNKMRAFENNQSNFSRGTLFAHDVSTDYDFEGMSQQLIQQLPPGTPASLVSTLDADAQSALVGRMNEGKLFVNYSGHGATGLWANSSFFTIFTVPQLTNSTTPSFYTMLTCLNGFYVRPDADSMSEALLFSNTGGAAATWASSGETTPDVQLAMGLRFYEQVSSGQLNRVGDLVKDAKTVISEGADVRLSWVLFGDPAMKMP